VYLKIIIKYFITEYYRIIGGVSDIDNVISSENNSKLGLPLIIDSIPRDGIYSIFHKKKPKISSQKITFPFKPLFYIYTPLICLPKYSPK